MQPVWDSGKVLGELGPIHARGRRSALFNTRSRASRRCLLAMGPLVHRNFWPPRKKKKNPTTLALGKEWKTGQGGIGIVLGLRRCCLTAQGSPVLPHARGKLHPGAPWNQILSRRKSHFSLQVQIFHRLKITNRLRNQAGVRRMKGAK